MIPTKRAILFLVAATIIPAGLLAPDNWNTVREGVWTSAAQARVGRPMTPMSYAGVARRTTRRTVAVTAGAAAYGATVGHCQQVVDAYGRITTQCYWERAAS